MNSKERTASDNRCMPTWIRRALQHVLNADLNTIVARDSEIGGARPLPQRPARYQRIEIGLQRHTIPEICIPLKGRAVMELDGRYYALYPGRVAIIEPGLLHCEGRWRGSKDYLLLWIIPGIAGSCGIHFDRSRRPQPWMPLRTIRFPSSATERLLARFAATSRTAAGRKLELLRGDLLAILGEAWSTAAELDHESDGQALHDEVHPIVKQIEIHLQTHLHTPISLRALGSMYHMNPDYLGRLFRKAKGIRPLAYMNKRRMETAADLCRNTSKPIKEIALGLGYADPLYFSRVFRQFHGQSPRALRQAASPFRVN